MRAILRHPENIGILESEPDVFEEFRIANERRHLEAEGALPVANLMLQKILPKPVRSTAAEQIVTKPNLEGNLQFRGFNNGDPPLDKFAINAIYAASNLHNPTPNTARTSNRI